MGAGKAIGIGCGSLVALVVAVPVAGYFMLKSMTGIDSSDPLDPEIEQGLCRDGVVKLADLTNVSWDQVYFGPSLDALHQEFGSFALRPFEGVDDPERQELIAFAQDGELVAVVSSQLGIRAADGRSLGPRAAVVVAEKAKGEGESPTLRATETPSDPPRPRHCGSS
ncbi:hypothetical protein AB0D04_22455 [Streptomyces sp. NPDC048483]|uniref:hypothetical protein n=1 Tax=Streptomyces sp. NPDC048483 TaxID=3154927 RepID=UPI003432E728